VEILEVGLCPMVDFDGYSDDENEDEHDDKETKAVLCIFVEI
jgi:hypothetical protein